MPDFLQRLDVFMELKYFQFERYLFIQQLAYWHMRFIPFSAAKRSFLWSENYGQIIREAGFV